MGEKAGAGDGRMEYHTNHSFYGTNTANTTPVGPSLISRSYLAHISLISRSYLAHMNLALLFYLCATHRSPTPCSGACATPYSGACAVPM